MKINFTVVKYKGCYNDMGSTSGYPFKSILVCDTTTYLESVGVGCQRGFCLVEMKRNDENLFDDQ